MNHEIRHTKNHWTQFNQIKTSPLSSSLIGLKKKWQPRFISRLSALRLVFVGWHSAGIALPTVRLPSALQTCKSSQCDREGHENWMLIISFTVEPHTSKTDAFFSHLYYLPTSHLSNRLLLTWISRIICVTTEYLFPVPMQKTQYSAKSTGRRRTFFSQQDALFVIVTDFLCLQYVVFETRIKICKVLH